MTPILIRSKDRVDYLYTTLKSLTGTILNDAYIVIVDDCSESDEMKKFLYSCFDFYNKSALPENGKNTDVIFTCCCIH